MNWSKGFPRCDVFTTRDAFDFGWKAGGETSVFPPDVVAVAGECGVDACVVDVVKEAGVDEADWVGVEENVVRGMRVLAELVLVVGLSISSNRSSLKLTSPKSSPNPKSSSSAAATALLVLA
jgi:hypothetical protein